MQCSYKRLHQISFWFDSHISWLHPPLLENDCVHIMTYFTSLCVCAAPAEQTHTPPFSQLCVFEVFYFLKCFGENVHMLQGLQDLIHHS